MTRLFLTLLVGALQAATWLPPEDVRLTPGPFFDAQEMDRAFLHELDPDRLLAGMREAAGLDPKASRYGGWEKRGSGMIGHYLSALAWMSQTTGDDALRARLDAIVAEMAEYQKHSGQGILFASPWERREWFEPLSRGDLRLSNVVPWYTLHKTMAGLRDAWLVAGNPTADEVLRRLADSCIDVTAKLTESQWKELTTKEFGAPGEVLADLWRQTGDLRYGELAKRFTKFETRDSLATGQGDILAGRHANTEIPLFLGYYKIGNIDGNPVWEDAAVHFWNEVIQHQTFVFGGNSIWEAFIPPTEAETKLLDDCGPETCNTFNLLKLTRSLWEANPEPRYLDYMELALHNHILTTIRSQGAFTYYTPTRPGHYRRFSRPFDAFWCCVGSGMENHAWYGSDAYAKDSDRFWVNLYLNSAARWPEKGLTLTQKSTFPDSDLHLFDLKLDQPAEFTLSLRRPFWAGEVRVRVNQQEIDPGHGDRMEIRRLWSSGDQIELHLPSSLRSVITPGGHFASFFDGPLLLAAPLGDQDLEKQDFRAGGEVDFEQLGRKRMDLEKAPGLLTPRNDPRVALRPLKGGHALLKTDQGEIEIKPFYQVGDERYSVYFPLRSPAP
ncbi:hypothetical protein HNR46_003478 [Haloferula luteola]|uniref:Non-reducing end beta-L-arabinofuranosidase n=1 Tax=Haloferula luteola TaxID=595692 RepID=A0A840V6E7_9BACT|nr:beta-L-arabinofuranosidase domain-containing protein [Haloferula luteola]MBB5353223.1 hypothetical protein [Haloferula luteola]